MNKKIHNLLLFTIAIAIPMFLLTACGEKKVPTGELPEYTVTYLTDGNGDIAGSSRQVVKERHACESVVAVAREGYYFVSWSDGIEEIFRYDMDIRSDLTLTAYFARKEITVTYTAGIGGKIEGNLSQTIYYGDDTESVTAIPEQGRTFVRWSDGVTAATRKDKNMKVGNTFRAEFSVKSAFDITFHAGKGGTLEGDTEQIIEFGESAATVTAVPDEDFEFVEWSDGDKNATRQIADVRKPVDLTAKFRRFRQTYTYVYNGATGGDEAESVTISRYDDWNFMRLPIPEREGYTFTGWYKEWHQSTMAFYPSGIHAMTKDQFFRDDGDKLYACWEADEKVVYPILMVFVTEIDGTFYNKDFAPVRVQYRLSDAERAVLETVPRMLQNHLNAMSNGEVTFVVDSVFTPRPIGSHCFTRGDSVGFVHYVIDAEKITDVSDLYKNYRSVITTFNLNDYIGNLRHINVVGVSDAKFAYIHAEMIFGNFVQYDAIEDLLNTGDPDIQRVWASYMEAYIHEFIHSAELQIEVPMGLHQAIQNFFKENGPYADDFELQRLYLMNSFYFEGKYYGIPLSFWKGQQAS